MGLSYMSIIAVQWHPQLHLFTMFFSSIEFLLFFLPLSWLSGKNCLLFSPVTYLGRPNYYNQGLCCKTVLYPIFAYFSSFFLWGYICFVCLSTSRNTCKSSLLCKMFWLWWLADQIFHKTRISDLPTVRSEVIRLIKVLFLFSYINFVV